MRLTSVENRDGGTISTEGKKHFRFAGISKWYQSYLALSKLSTVPYLLAGNRREDWCLQRVSCCSLLELFLAGAVSEEAYTNIDIRLSY